MMQVFGMGELTQAAKAAIRAKRMCYLHGLRSGPHSPRAEWMRTQLGADIVDYQPTKAIASSDAARAAGLAWRHPLPADLFRGPLSAARSAVTEREYDLLVGASFGAALAVELMHEGLWRGPALLLCCAAQKLRGHQYLPPGSRAVLVHGVADPIVAIDEVRSLASSPQARVELHEVDDGHGLWTIFDGPNPMVWRALHQALALN